MAYGIDRPRTLGRAILASLVLHALAFSASPGARRIPWPATPAPILARIAPQAEPRPAAGAVVQESLEPPRIARRVVPPAAIARLPAAPASEPRPSDPAQEAARPAAARNAQELDGASLAQYRFVLMSRAKRIHAQGAQPTPVRVSGDREEARAQVRVRIGTAGDVESVDVLASSGEARLDREASSLIARAAHEVPLPQALRGSPFSVEVWVIFAR